MLPSPPRPERPGPRLRTPTTNAIPLISPKDGKHYAILHTVAVVALFVIHFSALVAGPYRVMMLDLGPLVLLQCAFCASCLPSTGTWSNITSSDGSETAAGGGGSSGKPTRGTGMGSLRKRPPGLGRAGAPGAGGWKGKARPILISLTLTMLLPPIPLTVLAHIVGAPLYPAALILHTGVLCLHISLLACLPLFYTHGVSGPAWRDVIAAWLPFDEAGVWGGSVGTFVGGWLGAIPMALDWDRDWQAWPVTVLAGCYAGWATGKTLFGPVFLRDRRIDMSVAPEQEVLESHHDPKKGDKKSQ